MYPVLYTDPNALGGTGLVGGEFSYNTLLENLSALEIRVIYGFGGENSPQQAWIKHIVCRDKITMITYDAVRLNTR